jgi:hypothetical protein
MAQVNSENSTIIAALSTRRRFLSNAAGIAAAGTALALAIPPAHAAADPVFALIEAHRAADAALALACTEKSRLEGLGHWGADGGTEAAHDAEWSALADLIEAIPTTIAGHSLDDVHPRTGGRGLRSDRG